MRILFDARSVRTPAGVHVFQGLTRAWSEDPSVERVIAAVIPGFDRGLIPAGVEPVETPSASWVMHVAWHLPRLADRCRADIIFAPNAMAPRDPRSVMYFQDLFHFRSDGADGRAMARLARRWVRASWRAASAAHGRLAVAVSEDMLGEVRRRLRIPSVLIPNGVEVGDAVWEGSGDYVLVMGGTGARKDEGTAVRAWALLRPEIRASARLEVVGVEPAARRLVLQRLVEALGIEGAVTIGGCLPRDDFLARVARARLAISCSTFEAFSLPVAEALVLGAPVVCSDIPVHRELLRRAGRGDLFRTRDPAALARALEAALGAARVPHAPPARDAWSWRARAREHLEAYRRNGR